MAIRRVTWGEARREIKRACDVNPEVSYLKVYKDWQDGLCQVWGYGDLFLVTRVDNDIDGKTLVVCLMAGKSDPADGYNLTKYLDYMRRGYHCEKIKVIGRKGWERVLAQDGYKVLAVTLVKQCKKMYNFINHSSMTNYGAPIQWRQAYE